MPRPVDPKFGQDGYESEIKAFVVDADQLKPILSVLGLQQDPDAGERLQDALQAIGDRHRRWKERGPQAFSRAEAHKALRMVLKLKHIDGHAITGLNERAQHLVLDQLFMMKLALSPRGTTVTAALFANRIDDIVLRLATTRAVKALKMQKGADHDGGLAFCVGELCTLYEDLTGQAVTHFNKAGRLYSPDAASRAGRFVAACYKLIDPTALNHTLSGRILLWLKSRPAS